MHRRVLDALGDRQAARWLVEEASGGRLPYILDQTAPDRAAERLASMVKRRLDGEPVQYVLGHWPFRQLDLMVNRHVLIPRPETEVVVEVALAELDRLRRPQPKVADLGTGSGAIALAVATERPDTEVWATDLSETALSVASANLAGLGALAQGRVHLARGSWWDALPAHLAGRLDLVVTNPPYISRPEISTVPSEVKDWEPLTALVAGPSGTEALAAVLQGSLQWMAPGGAIVAEIAPHQAEEAVSLAGASGLLSASVLPDLAGLQRALVAHAP